MVIQTAEGKRSIDCIDRHRNEGERVWSIWLAGNRLQA